MNPCSPKKYSKKNKKRTRSRTSLSPNQNIAAKKAADLSNQLHLHLSNISNDESVLASSLAATSLNNDHEHNDPILSSSQINQSSSSSSSKSSSSNKFNNLKKNNTRILQRRSFNVPKTFDTEEDID